MQCLHIYDQLAIQFTTDNKFRRDNLPSSPSTSSVMASTSLCWQYVPVS